jgi:Uncharacterized protein conserved in bacteria
MIIIENQPIIQILTDIASIISEMFGSNCEVAISDLDNPEHSVMAIFNGHISNRKIGSPLISHAVNRIANAADGTFINYEKHGPHKEQRLKSSTYTFNIDGRNYSICINYDYTDIIKIKTTLDEFVHVSMDETDSKKGRSDYSSDSPIHDAIAETINELGKSVDLLDKDDRLYVISELHKKGILKLQHSVNTIAECLGVSRYSVYNYLNELGINR